MWGIAGLQLIPYSNLEAKFGPPAFFPTRVERRLREGSFFPITGDQPSLYLLIFPVFQRPEHSRPDMLMNLARGDEWLTLSDLFQGQGGDEGFIAQLRHGRENRLEVEYHCTRKRKTPQGLPVTAQIALFDSHTLALMLRASIRCVLAGRDKEWLPVFNKPRASLDGPVCWHLRKVAADEHLRLAEAFGTESRLG